MGRKYSQRNHNAEINKLLNDYYFHKTNYSSLRKRRGNGLEFKTNFTQYDNDMFFFHREKVRNLHNLIYRTSLTTQELNEIR